MPWCLSTAAIIAITIVGKSTGEEAPEDEGVHQARHEPLQQLALAEHDRRLVAHAPLHVVAPVDGLAREHEPGQEEAPRRPNSHPLNAEQRRERHRTGERLYCPMPSPAPR